MNKKTFVLDEYDKKLLYELDKDSSISLKKLSSLIGRSKQFTLFRLKRFEKEGIVTNYTAIVDMNKLGFFTFRFYIRFKQLTKEELSKIVEDLKTYENIWTIAVCHGKWDLAFFVGAKNIDEVHKVWDSFKLKYKQYIVDYNFCLYSPIYNFNRTFFLDDNNEIITRVYGRGKKEEIDENDLRIIREYAQNVRRSTLELSRIVNLSPETIIKRIKKLEKKEIICGYKIGLNIEKLGYVSYRIDLQLSSVARNAELLEYCKQHKNIYQVNKTIGGADFEIEAVVANLNELLDIIEDIKIRFKDVVDTASYFSYSAYYLLTYIPD